MVTIRWARAGCKKRPFYHVVVANSEAPRDGRFIETLGFYDPRREEGGTRLDAERLAAWVAKGAQLSVRVKHVLRDLRKAEQAAAAA